MFARSFSSSSIRAAAALVLAPMVPVIGFGVAAYPAHLLVIIYGGIAALAVMILGVAPYLLVLLRTGRYSAPWVIVGGGCAAALPWVAIELWQATQSSAASVAASGEDLVIGGRLTIAGWLADLRIVVVLLLLGAIGGAVFWIVAVGWRIRPRPDG